MVNPDSEIAIDYSPRFRMYKSGRVERFAGADTVPSGLDAATGVNSKDVAVEGADAGVSARLYLPDLVDGDRRRLPVLVYFHGGGFCIETAFSPTYHNYHNSLASRANVLVVSVNYRRAPEHLLPAAYEDSWAALRWVASHSSAGAGTEEWLLRHGDFGRVFIAGDSAGGNIAHQMALRAGTMKIGDDVELEGALLVHPYFWGTTPVGEETTNPLKRAAVESLWKVTTPPEMGVDHPAFNPISEAAPCLSGLACRRLAVVVAMEDIFKERGRTYFEKLKGSGWQGTAELWETEEEGHVFHLLKPRCDKALEMMEYVVKFFSDDIV